jgi:hypothetical protein
MFSFLYHCQDFYRTWLYIYEEHGGRLIRSRNGLLFASTWVHARLFSGSVLLIFLVSMLSYYVTLRSEFRVVRSVTISAWKRRSVRLYLQLFVGGRMSYLLYLCLFAYSGVQHILCCVFVFLHLVYPMLTVSLCSILNVRIVWNYTLIYHSDQLFF